MLLVRTDGKDPGLSGLKSATKRADGVVEATDPHDVAMLTGAGYVPAQCQPGNDYRGALAFQFKSHSGLLAAIR